ncbi:hypothetical protein K466DRAFT_663995 [Polyporus arcularius HHB13444]|uniref:HNH nuclease domain-containing protein n=1 Tax=Polyporus arcularius HHB13444 TaxID=1314778 RepID=A0A5C3P9B5_9APHY|nr:hypothetical protein K466DRAFT_663995 [Polyporus arcularius HHB13444]
MDSDSAASVLATVRVFVQLPDSIPVAPNPDLAHWDWRHILSIPVSILNEHRFSLKPYKWIRFAAGIIFGVIGHLKPSKQPNDASCDYEIGELANESFDVYYHTLPEQIARLQPVDPDIFDERLAVTHTSSRASTYRHNVGERDGHCCVLTDFVQGCEAVHVVPHVKSNEYIRRLTERNGVREEREKDVIADIDDCRNGLYLQAHLHRRYGSDFAFLQTPNFAMLPSDVPGPGNVPDPTVAPARCTAHVFDGPIVLGATPQRTIVESGSPVRIADRDWPPPILFDVTYASLVLKTFGVQATVDAIKNIWQDQLTFGVPKGTVAENAFRSLEEKKARKARKPRTEENDKRAELDALDLLRLIPYLGVPPERVREYWAAEHTKQESDDQRRSEAKVSEWRDRCADAGL